MGPFEDPRSRGRRLQGRWTKADGHAAPLRGRGDRAEDLPVVAVGRLHLRGRLRLGQKTALKAGGKK